MSADTAGALLLPFAILGAVGLGVRLARSLLRLGVAAAETTAAQGLAEVSARRGDLSALAEHRARARALSRSRWVGFALLLLWLVLLAAPPLLGWAREAYAAAALLWLLPRATRRPA